LEDDKGSINISNVQGIVSGINYDWTGNIVGENIVVEPGIITINKRELANMPNGYAECIKTFSEVLSAQLKSSQLPKDQAQSIIQNINELADVIEDVKPEAEKELDYEKQKNIPKTWDLIKRILNVLPQTAETGVIFTPLTATPR